MPTSTAARRVGSEVRVDDPKYPGIWIVRSNGPVNATLEPKDGGRGLRCPHTALLDPDAEPTTPARIGVNDLFSPGEFVTLTGAGVKYDGLWIVNADRGSDKVNLVRPGGENGRYLRATRRGLTKVTVAEAVEILMAGL